MTESTGPVSPTGDLVAAVEAVLFAAAEPVHPKEIAAAFEGATESEVAAAIDALRERYADGPGGLTVPRLRPAAPRLAVRRRGRPAYRPRGTTGWCTSTSITSAPNCPGSAR